MKCPKCKAENDKVFPMEDGEAIGCSNCGEISQNHKGAEILKVQVTVVFEIPITEGDKQHILWKNSDDDNEEGKQEHINFAKEILGYGVFRTAELKHCRKALKLKLEKDKEEDAGHKGKAEELQFEIDREDKYINMIHYSQREYKILEAPK